jgi:hypothetical protein
LARAKNTSRAEARKRSRDTHRAEMAELADDEQLDDEVDSGQDEPRRPSAFKMPNVREDLRALPEIFRTKRIVWVPFLLVLIGFVLNLAYWGLSADLRQIAGLYISFFFVPQGLFAYFIAGFVAPRASYLIGGLLGLLSGALFGIALVATLPPDIDVVLRAQAHAEAMSSPFTGALLGTFAGGFAAWYRNFLRGMQVNGAQRRADREAKERAKRREERQQARSVFKSKS